MKISREEALEILELEDTDDHTVIRKAYRRQAIKWHPDKNPDNEEEAKVKFQKIGAAYHRLTKDEDSDEEDEGFGASPFDEDDELAAMLFEFLMRKMYERRSAGATFFTATFTPASSYAPHQRQQVPVDRPPYCNTNSWAEYNADESDDSEADFDFSAAEEREFIRAEQQKRQAAARQQRAQEQRERAARKARAAVENQAKAEETRVAEQTARAAAEEAELLRRVISQLPRPIMSSRTETSITLSLARLIKTSGDDKLPKQCIWELEMKTPPGGSWHTIHPMHGSLSVVADRLTPGTKYIFRARAAQKRGDGSLDWGKYSEESYYATAGKSPAAESASVAASDASKKGKRREAAVRKEERRPQQTAPSKSQELDEEAEKQRLQAEKQKAAAIKAAQEKAAQDYEREVQQLNAMKLQNEARINEKVKKAKQKARKKEEAVHTDEPEGAKAIAQEEEELPKREQPPRPPPYRSAPVLRAYNETFSDCFGNVQRTSPGGLGQAPSPAPSSQWAPAAPGQSMYADDDISDAEMAQLVAALEESERSAKREAEARQATWMSDTAYPSLPTSTIRPGQSTAGGPKRSYAPANQPAPPRSPGPVPGSTAHMRPQAPALPLQAQPVQTAQHLNGRPVSSPRPQPLQHVRQQAPAQQQVQATHQQPHMTGHTPPSRLPARKQYSPQVAAPGGNAPQQHAAEVGWEAATDEPRKLNGPQVPAHAESAPEWQAPATDWEAPPPPQQHAADWEWEPAKQTHAPQVQKHASRMPQKQAPDMGWEPAGQTQSVQAPAHAGNMPRQHAPNAEWDAPPQQHHRQPAKQTYSPQVPPHVPGRPGSAGGVPPRRLNGQPVKMPVRQLPNGTHQQNGFPAQQSHANQGYTSLPAPTASPARVKLTAPVRKAYHPMGTPSARQRTSAVSYTGGRPARYPAASDAQAKGMRAPALVAWQASPLSL